MPRTADRQETTVARLRLVLLRLARRMRQEAGTDVTPSQLSALSTVRRHGPLRLGALAELERVSRPTMTRIVATLEDAGYLERAPDPLDGRSVLVRLSVTGARRLDDSRERADAFLAQQVAALDPADRAVLTEAVPLLERLLEVSE